MKEEGANFLWQRVGEAQGIPVDFPVCLEKMAPLGVGFYDAIPQQSPSPPQTLSSSSSTPKIPIFPHLATLFIVLGTSHMRLNYFLAIQHIKSLCIYIGLYVYYLGDVVGQDSFLHITDGGGGSWCWEIMAVIWDYTEFLEGWDLNQKFHTPATSQCINVHI